MTGLSPSRSSPTKKILCVTLHFDDTHTDIRRPYKLPQGMGAVFLASAFNPDLCRIKVYSELYSGPLQDRSLLAWPDMIVLTGVTNCFDRMLHITAYARSLNPRVIVVVGGPAIRALPCYSSRFFDYCCLGDIEELQDVILDAFGPHYIAQEMIPRLDLAYWIKHHGHVETSRYCNFHCRFCSLSGEKRTYRPYRLSVIEKQFQFMGPRYSVHFIDNNFYGPDRDFFLAKLELINHYRKKGWFKYWSALVSGDFFLNEDNLRQAAASGCGALFSGVESFDRNILHRYRKKQNTLLPQEKMITSTLNQGIAFWYGLILDVYQRPVTELRDELEFILANTSIPLPGFITLPIPLLGTEYFQDCLRRGFFPNTRLRHLDGTTLCMQPVSPVAQAVDLVRTTRRMSGYRKQVIAHGLSFAARYRSTLAPGLLRYALAPNILLLVNTLLTAATPFPARIMGQRSHVSSSEILDPSYTPVLPVAERYRSYFQPTLITDDQGQINQDLVSDIFHERSQGKSRHALSSL